jgi:hypothetical protein
MLERVHARRHPIKLAPRVPTRDQTTASDRARLDLAGERDPVIGAVGTDDAEPR